MTIILQIFQNENDSYSTLDSVIIDALGKVLLVVPRDGARQYGPCSRLRGRSAFDERENVRLLWL